ncbi:tRNA (N(6)-L-threonylcarbamoyladenosine(37)-C(2))-methylthiotransferase MtaB [Mycoplasmatota bacterium WC44]
MKIAFYTLGCKVNTYDTESVWEVFKEKGYERASFDEFADVYVINTCTVTNQSDSKSRKIIRQAIRKNQDAVVVVMGCYAQVSPDEISSIEGVDIITGTKNRKLIVSLVEEILEDRKQINVVTDLSNYFDELAVKSYTDNTRAFLKIEDGCDNYCSYCIIPYARGHVVSKKVENVLTEAKELVSNGFKELILSGIHTGKYGIDVEYTLTQLVRDLVKIVGLKRLRISSIEINEITDELLFLIKENDNIANHLHIPLQSGSDTVLNDMNRKYNTKYFSERINYIRSVIPNISITTDVIVGYPTETEELFEETYEFIEYNEFSELHVFPFSKRNGTPAAKLKDLDKIIKSDRVKSLLILNDKLASDYAKKFEGQVVDVIIETVNDKSTGYSSNYLKIEIPEVLHKNDYLDVKVIEAGYPVNKAIL